MFLLVAVLVRRRIVGGLVVSVSVFASFLVLSMFTTVVRVVFPVPVAMSMTVLSGGVLVRSSLWIGGRVGWEVFRALPFSKLSDRFRDATIIPVPLLRASPAASLVTPPRVVVVTILISPLSPSSTLFPIPVATSTSTARSSPLRVLSRLVRTVMSILPVLTSTRLAPKLLVDRFLRRLSLPFTFAFTFPLFPTSTSTFTAAIPTAAATSSPRSILPVSTTLLAVPAFLLVASTTVALLYVLVAMPVAATLLVGSPISISATLGARFRLVMVPFVPPVVCCVRIVRVVVPLVFVVRMQRCMVTSVSTRVVVRCEIGGVELGVETRSRWMWKSSCASWKRVKEDSRHLGGGLLTRRHGKKVRLGGSARVRASYVRVRVRHR